jgi:hypothetical protein
MHAELVTSPRVDPERAADAVRHIEGTAALEPESTAARHLPEAVRPEIAAKRNEYPVPPPGGGEVASGLAVVGQSTRPPELADLQANARAVLGGPPIKISRAGARSPM